MRRARLSENVIITRRPVHAATAAQIQHRSYEVAAPALRAQTRLSRTTRNRKRPPTCTSVSACQHKPGNLGPNRLDQPSSSRGDNVTDFRNALRSECKDQASEQRATLAQLNPRISLRHQDPIDVVACPPPHAEQTNGRTRMADPKTSFTNADRKLKTRTQPPIRKR